MSVWWIIYITIEGARYPSDDLYFWTKNTFILSVHVVDLTSSRFIEFLAAILMGATPLSARLLGGNRSGSRGYSKCVIAEPDTDVVSL
jgi:hypothetical protein